MTNHTGLTCGWALGTDETGCSGSSQQSTLMLGKRTSDILKSLVATLVTLVTLETLETVEISLGLTPHINSGDMQLTTLMNNGHH